MPEFRYITLELMQEVCHVLAVDLFQKEREPIAGFAAADLALLDSAIQAPRAGFGEYEAYPTI